jgi:hypothetical protein
MPIIGFEANQEREEYENWTPQEQEDEEDPWTT